MGAKKKIIGAAGKFGAGYGSGVKSRFSAVEAKQRIKQICPFCKGRAKRKGSGIWACSKCKKNFTGGAYYLELASKRRKS
ncbi:MAG: 50S ribosomal protein L37ae [Nanoarchaeota archaeon]|nr:50S ribosomal protein L37ae [Nanoarchaeota archaeon]